MVNKRFSLHDAYAFGARAVTNHFMFFFVTMLLAGFAAIVVLSILGIVDYMMFREHFEAMINLASHAMNEATGLVYYAGTTFYESVRTHLPVAVSKYIAPKEVVMIDISGQDIKELVKFLLPVAIGFKLFLEMISVGWTKIALDVQANKTVEYDYLYKYLYFVPRVFVVELIAAVVSAVGFMLFVIPGVFVYQRLRFARYFVIDKNQSIRQALESSWHMTEGSVIHLCGYSIFASFLMGLGRILFPAMFFLVPLSFQADANVYRQMTK